MVIASGPFTTNNKCKGVGVVITEWSPPMQGNNARTRQEEGAQGINKLIKLRIKFN